MIDVPSRRMSPLVGSEHAGDAVEQRRLARAVRADDPEDLAAVDVDATRRRGRRRRRTASSTSSRTSTSSCDLVRRERRSPRGSSTSVGTSSVGRPDARPPACSVLLALASTAPMPRSPVASASSAARWRLGSRPWGRKIIMSTRARPNRKNAVLDDVGGLAADDGVQAVEQPLAPGRRRGGTRAGTPTAKAPAMTPGSTRARRGPRRRGSGTTGSAGRCRG